MRRKDWAAEMKEITNGQPLISKNQIRKLGYGPGTINRLVDGLDRYQGGKGGHGLYSVQDVAERLMGARI